MPKWPDWYTHLDNATITKILLFGKNKLNFETNKMLLMSTIEFTLLTDTERERETKTETDRQRDRDRV